MLPCYEQDHMDCQKLFHCIDCDAAFFYEDSLQYDETKCYKQPLDERNASAEHFFTLLEEIQIDKRKKRYAEDKEKAKKAAESKEKEISDSKTAVSTTSKRGRSSTKKSNESSGNQMKRKKSESPKKSGVKKRTKCETITSVDHSEGKDEELEKPKKY